MSRCSVALALLLGPCCVHAAITCRLVSTPGLAFGPYDSLSRVPTDTLTNIRVTCERNGGPQNITLTMRLGGGNSASVHARRLRQVGGAGDVLGYGLYRDVTRSTVWGETDSVDTVSQTLSIPNKATQSVTFTVYGRIPALQDGSAGTYADSVEITLLP